MVSYSAGKGDDDSDSEGTCNLRRNFPSIQAQMDANGENEDAEEIWKQDMHPDEDDDADGEDEEVVKKAPKKRSLARRIKENPPKTVEAVRKDSPAAGPSSAKPSEKKGKRKAENKTSGDNHVESEDLVSAPKPKVPRKPLPAAIKNKARK